MKIKERKACLRIIKQWLNKEEAEEKRRKLFYWRRIMQRERNSWGNKHTHTDRNSWIHNLSQFTVWRLLFSLPALVTWFRASWSLLKARHGFKSVCGSCEIRRTLVLAADFLLLDRNIFRKVAVSVRWLESLFDVTAGISTTWYESSISVTWVEGVWGVDAKDSRRRFIIERLS